MFEITKRFTFSASHALTHLPSEHKCFRLHGHNYAVTVTCASEMLDGKSFVCDYADISEAAGPLIDELDHRDLNTVFADPHRTTAESLARWFFGQLQSSLPTLACVEVCETENTSAKYWARR